ncbi:hypothetical protein [Actinoplanes sp. NPDC049265]|uniref:hypothetical protein n=1 Tax=Actinoplanes sp. NPDC049265 TaxID=3363902 RepID=UPI00371F6A36
MSMQISSVALTVVTSDGIAEYRARIGPGFNVLNAANSWGKSTLLQAIVYALGLEGSQSASRRSPLGPAMTTVVETSVGRYAVVESYVTLTVVNGAGQYLKVRRWGLSPDVKRDLLQVWRADTELALDHASQVDMFVRESGSTTSRAGFHRLLAEFLGWTLPLVPNFSGGVTRLYLEVLFPLFYIEQKFGWSGIAPRIPTHYGIREPLRRGVEYVLGLNTLARLRDIEALKDEEASLSRDWGVLVNRALVAAQTENFRLVGLGEKPSSAAQRRAASLEVNVAGEWIAISAAEERWRHRLGELRTGSDNAGERTAQTRAELAQAERELQRLGAVARNLREQVELSRGDQDAIAMRLKGVEEDKKKLGDVKRIERLGGELELPLLAEGRCPTCSQEVDVREVVTESVSSVDENIALLDAERVTLLSMQGSATQRLEELARSARAADAAMSEARDRVRLLRDELIGPSNAPSLADVQERLSIDGRLRAAKRVRELVAVIDEELDELAISLDEVRAKRIALGTGVADKDDQATLLRFRTSFQEQLIEYNLRSLSPESVTIDERTLLPVNDGFELTFDVAMGMSASDTIRTKWAYYTALLEAATQPGAHHLGLLMLDEPRQQETDRASLAAFLRRLRRDSSSAQIIYATSEDSEVLSSLLTDVPHTLLPAAGPHLIDFR